MSNLSPFFFAGTILYNNRPTPLMKTSLTAMVYRQQADSVLNFVMSDISPDQPKPSSE